MSAADPGERHRALGRLLIAGQLAGLRFRQDAKLGTITIFPEWAGERACGVRDARGWSACACDVCQADVRKEHAKVVKRWQPTPSVDPGRTEAVLVEALDRPEQDERAMLFRYAANGHPSPWRSGRSSVSATPPARERQSLASTEAATALAFAVAQPLRRGWDRREVVAEFWLQLANPSRVAAKRVQRAPLWKRMPRAWTRALANVRRARGRELLRERVDDFDSDASGL